MKHPVFKLNNGVDLPAVGLGVFQSGEDGTVEAVKTALSLGYRMIDTAAAYGNEAYVGQGLRESDVAPEEVFVQTKLWMSDYGFDKALHGFDRSMNNLGLETLDLYLLHWPGHHPVEDTIAAFGVSASKDVEGIAKLVAEAYDDVILTQAHKSGAGPQRLAPYLEQANKRYTITADITEAVVKHCGGAADHVYVVFEDIPATDFIVGGQTVADRIQTPLGPAGRFLPLGFAR